MVFQGPKTEVAERRFIRSPTEKADMVKSFAIVINLPESFGSKEAKKMVRELKTEMKKEPPRVILDLSRVKTMDCAGLHGLLTCMQEIARYDCAIQLQAVSPEAATLLELARMDHLFRKFPSDRLAFLLSQGQSAGKQRLLFGAEELFRFEFVFASIRASQESEVKRDNILVVRIDAIESRSEVIKRVVVADHYQHIA